MIDLILLAVFVGSIGAIAMGLWGFKKVSSKHSITIDGNASVSIQTYPTHTIIANNGDKPIRVKLS